MRSLKCRRYFYLLLTVFVACGNPKIDRLIPADGPPRTLVEIRGSTFLAGIRWDAGTAQEAGLAGGFLGGYIFSVPPNSPLGVHNVQLRLGARRGNAVPFTVTNAQPFGSPRLDRASIVSADFLPNNEVNAVLCVQGANIDVGAEVLVNGVVQPTVAFSGIRNDLLGVQPQSLGDPIYHYLALLAVPGRRAAGDTLAIAVRNLDGRVSNALNYPLPGAPETLDSDGDDIPDLWEINGFDADGDGTVDVDLPGMGADPHRIDIFIEVDIMQGLANPPGAAAFQAVRNAFAAAPVINPFGANGINMFIDTSGTVPFSQTIDLTNPANPRVGFTNFYTLKGANFNNNIRGRIFHYCIWANARPNGSSGISDVAITGGQISGPGDDFIVSFDAFPRAFQTVRSAAETFMHELGHNLQQRHGGVDNDTANPVYSSVMSYSWQLRSGLANQGRVVHPIYFPFYYGQNGAQEVGGAIPAGGAGTIIDYSEGMGRTLNEASLDEPTGLYNNIGVDWNNDGDILDANVVADASQDLTPNENLTDFANWANLVFSGPRRNGQR